MFLVLCLLEAIGMSIYLASLYTTKRWCLKDTEYRALLKWEIVGLSIFLAALVWKIADRPAGPYFLVMSAGGVLKWAVIPMCIAPIVSFFQYRKYGPRCKSRVLEAIMLSLAGAFMICSICVVSTYSHKVAELENAEDTYQALAENREQILTGIKEEAGLSQFDVEKIDAYNKKAADYDAFIKQFIDHYPEETAMCLPADIWEAPRIPYYVDAKLT